MLTCLLMSVGFLSAKNEDNDINCILIINAYTESTPWSNSLIFPIVNMASQNNKVGIYTEHMNMLMLDSRAELEEFEENMFKGFASKRPKLIVLLEVGSYILCED